MISLSSVLLLAHLVGIALAVGAATVKLTLLLKSISDPTLLPAFVKIARPVTRLIIIGMILLALSGIGWLIDGYPFTFLLIVKIVLVAAIFALGPVIDNVIEPRFRELMPAPGEPVTPAFVQVRGRYIAAEVTATLLFYVIILIWVLR